MGKVSVWESLISNTCNGTSVVPKGVGLTPMLRRGPWLHVVLPLQCLSLEQLGSLLEASLQYQGLCYIPGIPQPLIRLFSSVHWRSGLLSRLLSPLPLNG